MNACGNQTGDVSHVYHEVCSYRLCDLGQTLEVDDAGICTCTGNDQLRLDFLCQSLGTVVVDIFIIAQFIGNEVEVLAGDVDRRTVCQVAAVCQAHAHNRIARLEQCEVYGSVCLCTGVGLYIGILGTEQLAGTFDSDLLYYVYIFAAAVVPLVGQTFCILVGEGRPIAAITAGETRFSLAISSRFRRWRPSSSFIACPTSGSNWETKPMVSIIFAYMVKTPL